MNTNEGCHKSDDVYVFLCELKYHLSKELTKRF